MYLVCTFYVCSFTFSSIYISCLTPYRNKGVNHGLRNGRPWCCWDHRVLAALPQHRSGPSHKLHQSLPAPRRGGKSPQALNGTAAFGQGKNNDKQPRPQFPVVQCSPGQKTYTEHNPSWTCFIVLINVCDLQNTRVTHRGHLHCRFAI
jgi:hypothetical protein